jgi:hypothetical protein
MEQKGDMILMIDPLSFWDQLSHVEDIKQHKRYQGCGKISDQPDTQASQAWKDFISKISVKKYGEL